MADSTFVFALIAVAGALMASNRVRYDVIALLVVLALMLSGSLSVGQTLAGFGSSVVILVVGLLVVGEMLARTGVARAVGDLILKKGGGNETRLLVLIMASAALLGSVMSSTAIVAIFIPIVLRIAAQTRLNASRLLMPMSYAALISGMLTLIATTPNIVVHEELKTAGYDGFGFFSFAPVGVAILVVAILYVLFVGRKLLPGDVPRPSADHRQRTAFELWGDFNVGERIERLQIGQGSPLANRTLAQSALESRYGVRIHGILRHAGRSEERLSAPPPDTVLYAGDELVAVGLPEGHERLVAEEGVTRLEKTERYRQRWFWEYGGAAVLVHPDSRLVGKSLRDAEFRSRHGLHVMGVRRNREPLEGYKDEPLKPSDSLLIVGPWSRIRQLQNMVHDFVVLEMPSEYAEIVPSYRRMPIALAILVTMVLLTIFDVVPLVAAVLMAALAAVFSRCLTMEEAYRAIPWSSIVLIGGMLPLADALDATGGTDLIVRNLLDAVGDSGPGVMLTVIFFLTAGLGLVLSNTASAVLVAPIAITAAEVLGVSPYPFGVAVLVAASAAYSTPVSTPVVTLVVEPGRYGFTDFVKVGVPLLLLTYVVTLLVAPWLFPYHPS